MRALVRRLLLVCMLLGVRAADLLSADKMDTTLPQAYGDYGADAARATRESMGTTGDASVADKASSTDTSNAERTSGLAKGTFRLAEKTSKLIKRKMVPLKQALTAVRPWSFSATLSPVFLGTALAFQMEGKFDVNMLVLSLITSLGVHAAGNLMNTYFDYKNGVDKLGVTSDTTLVDGKMQPRQVTRRAANAAVNLSTNPPPRNGAAATSYYTTTLPQHAPRLLCSSPTPTRLRQRRPFRFVRSRMRR